MNLCGGQIARPGTRAEATEMTGVTLRAPSVCWLLRVAREPPGRRVHRRAGSQSPARGCYTSAEAALRAAARALLVGQHAGEKSEPRGPLTLPPTAARPPEALQGHPPRPRPLRLGGAAHPCSISTQAGWNLRTGGARRGRTRREGERGGDRADEEGDRGRGGRQGWNGREGRQGGGTCRQVLSCDTGSGGHQTSCLEVMLRFPRTQ